MKTLLRVAAVLSFGCCFVGGLTLIGPAVQSHSNGTFLLVAVGLVFIGVAFFVGSLLLVVAERFDQTQATRTRSDGKTVCAMSIADFGARINWRLVLVLVAVFVIGIVCLYAVRLSMRAR